MNLLPVQCAEPGCPYKAHTGGRCKEHIRGWPGKDYGSGWPKIRRAHLEREPDCRVCRNLAVTVDHILAKEFGGTDNEENLQSLCRRHADQKNHADSELGKMRKRERR